MEGLAEKDGKEEKAEPSTEKTDKPDAEKDGEKQGEPAGVAESILSGLSNIVPSLGGLLKVMGKSPAFRERLKGINNEVDRKLRETPLKKAGTVSSSDIRTGFSVSTAIEGDRPGARQPSPKDHGKELRPEKPREIPVDVFDEGDHLRVIAELPGVEEKDISVNVEGVRLIISAQTADRKYHQVVDLPGESGGHPETRYLNGILEVRLEKLKP